MTLARLLLIFSLTAAALPAEAAPLAGGQWLLTGQEFARLTPREKKEYLKGVRKIMASLSERSELFAGGAVKTRDVANEAETAHAAQVEAALTEALEWRGKVPADIKDYQKDKETYANNFNQSMWWLVVARMRVDLMPDDDGLKKNLVARVEKLEKFFVAQRPLYERSFDKNKKLTPAYNALQAAKKGDFDLEQMPEGSLVMHGTGISLRTAADRAAQQPAPPAPPAPASRFDDAIFTAPPADPELKAALEAYVDKNRDRLLANAGVPPAAPATPAATEDRPHLGGYRCMYSGFVIEKDPCKGPWKLPDNVKLPSLDGSQFQCAENQVMCNPLLFGVKKSCALKSDMPEGDAKRCLLEAKPLCLSKSKSATADCTKESSSDEALESAAALIQFNPDAWNKYLKGFYELCDDMMIDFNGFAEVRDGQRRVDPEAARAEIGETCKNAKVRLKELTDKFRSVDATRPSSPAAPKGDRLKPAGKPTEGQQ